MDTQVKTRAAIISVASNLCLMIAKFVVGLLSGSISVISEAIHSGNDLIAALIALFAVKESSKPRMTGILLVMERSRTWRELLKPC